jgi:hypothetical protein
MPDLVNDSGKSQLSSRNSEPTHNAGAQYDDLGGPTWDHKGGPDAYKIDASKGVGAQDKSIPHAVAGEPTHRAELKPGIVEDEKVDVDFGDDDKDLKEEDDLDKELAKYESVDDPDVDVKVDEDDEEDDDKKPLKEDNEQGSQGNPAGQSEIKKQKNGVQGDESTTDQTDDFVKEDDGDASAKGTDDGKLGYSDVQEDDEDKKFPFKSKDEEDGLKEDDEDKDDDKKDLKESFKIRIKLPKAPLFESVDKSQRKQVAVLFEQAIRENTKSITKQLTEHFNGKLKNVIAKRDAVMAKQVDAYLTYVTEEWTKANKVAIKTNIRTQLAEELLNGLHGLLKEHYIDVPASKIDVVKQLTAQNAKLKGKLNEEHGKMLKLRRLAESANKQRIVAQFSRGMSDAQVSKLQKLTEDVPYTNAAEFRNKLTMLKESYFGDGKTDVSKKRLPLTEAEVKEDVKSEKTVAVSNDPIVAAAAAALKNQADASKW